MFVYVYIYMLRSVTLFAAMAGAASIGLGEKVPDVTLDYGFPPEKVALGQRLAGKKVILLGLPGAFTPT